MSFPGNKPCTEETLGHFVVGHTTTQAGKLAEREAGGGCTAVVVSARTLLKPFSCYCGLQSSRGFTITAVVFIMAVLRRLLPCVHIDCVRNVGVGILHSGVLQLHTTSVWVCSWTCPCYDISVF